MDVTEAIVELQSRLLAVRIHAKPNSGLDRLLYSAEEYLQLAETLARRHPADILSEPRRRLAKPN
jgi:hypothetical protein